MKYIYKYCSIKDATLILNSENIRFSSPNQFKDKKDVPISLIDYDTSNMHSDYLSDLKELNKRFPNSKDYINNSRIIKDMYRFSIHQKYNRMRISCFSLNGNSNYCWHHHSGNYKGICIKFDVNQLFEDYTADTFSAGKVKYINKYKTHNLLKVSKIKFYNYWLYNKLKRKYWQEEEVRFIHLPKDDVILTEPFLDFRFNLHSIQNITFGKKAKESDKTVIKNLIGSKGLDIEYCSL